MPTRGWVTNKKPHPDKGKRVRVELNTRPTDQGLGQTDVVTVVDWFDRTTGTTVRDVFGDKKDSVATRYMKRRRGFTTVLPIDDQVVVVYKGTGRRYAVHNSEIKGVYDGERSE